MIDWSERLEWLIREEVAGYVHMQVLSNHRRGQLTGTRVSRRSGGAAVGRPTPTSQPAATGPSVRAVIASKEV